MKHFDILGLIWGACDFEVEVEEGAKFKSGWITNTRPPKINYPVT